MLLHDKKYTCVILFGLLMAALLYADNATAPTGDATASQSDELQKQIEQARQQVSANMMDTAALNKLIALRAEQKRQRRQACMTLARGLTHYLNNDQQFARKLIGRAAQHQYIKDMAKQHLLTTSLDQLLKIENSPAARTSNKTCSLCGGTGRMICSACDGNGYIRCKVCGGTGVYKTENRNILNQQQVCITCNKLGAVPCEKCRGEGYVDCTRCKGQSATTPGAAAPAASAIISSTTKRELEQLMYRAMYLGMGGIDLESQTGLQKLEEPDTNAQP